MLIEVGGVGYEVHMPMTCFMNSLKRVRKRSFSPTLWCVKTRNCCNGFNNKQERTLFKELIKTNGVGPKLALAILSGMSAQQFVNAVEREEVGHW